MPSKTQSAKAITSSSRSCALLAQSLKLYDCLIKVTSSDSAKSVFFWLSCYLRKSTGLQKDGSLDCAELSYPKFVVDLESHFDYNPDTHELQWHNHMAGSPAKLESPSDDSDPSHSVESFSVESHNSWVAALMIMQATNASSNLQASSVPDSSPATATPGSPAPAGPTTTAPAFMIVRKKDEDCTSRNVHLGNPSY